MKILISIPALLVLILATPSLAEGIYRWVDEDGVVHFSDVPRDGADEVEVQPVQTFSAPSVPVASAKEGDDAAEEVSAPAALYESVAITSPGMEETIWNTGGNVTVSVSLNPALRQGHRITLYMDGRALGDMPPGATSLVLTEVVRGTHQLKAVVSDAVGTVLAESKPTTFFYKQTAVRR